MTSSNGNIFRVTGHLCGEFTGHRWVLCKKGQWRQWFETPSNPLWHHCNEICDYKLKALALSPWTGLRTILKYRLFLVIASKYHTRDSCELQALNWLKRLKHKNTCDIFYVNEVMVTFAPLTIRIIFQGNWSQHMIIFMHLKLSSTKRSYFVQIPTW